MTGTIYDIKLIQIRALFENITKTTLKDCFELQEKMIFVLMPGQIKKALGKDKTNITRIESKIGMKIRIIEFSTNVLQFVTNAIFPHKINDIEFNEGIITIKGKDMKTNGLIIGSRAQNLRNTEKIVQKFFPEVKEIKVV
jgi:transcription termination/antitermination protein NusA